MEGAAPRFSLIDHMSGSPAGVGVNWTQPASAFVLWKKFTNAPCDSPLSAWASDGSPRNSERATRTIVLDSILRFIIFVFTGFAAVLKYMECSTRQYFRDSTLSGLEMFEE